MAETRQRLTDLEVKKIQPPAKGQVIHLDNSLPGFGLRVSQGGTKTFVLTYGKERTRITIGRYPLISLADAREEAKRKLAEFTLTGRSSSPSLQTLTTSFLRDVEQRAKPRTYQGYKRLLDRHLKLTKSTADVQPRDLSRIFDKLQDTPQERSHLIAVVKMLFRYAQLHGHINHNPAIGFVVHPPKARHRTLTEPELSTIWRVTTTDTFDTIVKLLILTGQRRGEIQHISIDGDLATIPGEHTKNGRPHTFPVDEITKGLFAEPLAFNGWGKAKARLDQRAGIAPWTLHDLRRTYATIHAKLGTPPHIIERLLNHATGKVSGVAAVYNRYQYLDEMREAVRKYTDHIASIVSDKQFRLRT